MLRVGIVLDSYSSSAWITKVIEEIRSSGFARAELVLLQSGAHDSRQASGAGWRRRLNFFSRYQQWDYRRNKSTHDALAPVDISSLLQGIPSISVHADGIGAIGDVPERQLAEIRSHNLDVLFCFEYNNLGGSLSGTARYGIWSFVFGNSSGDCREPALFRELMKRNSVSASSLRILSSTPQRSRTIYQGYASTDQLSLYGTRNPVYWKTAEFALRCLRELDQRGMEYIESLPVDTEMKRATSSETRAPNGIQMAIFLRRYMSRWFHARLMRLRPGLRTKWFIAIRPKGSLHFDDPSGYKLMPCPADRFYADPFFVERDGKTLLFFEDFRYIEGRAVISCCELGADGTPGSPVEVLRRPYHLSYPYVFEHEGEMYMIPETQENRMVELYRATSFPTGWIHEGVLLQDIHAVDATVQKIAGRFWMFAGVSNGKYSNSDELCLFYADELKGPWTPHPRNPLLSDVRRSRPAGHLFYDQGRLIRPSQDCSKVYGYALVFSEVLALSETEYKEQIVSRLNPESTAGCIGTHTYNRTEKFEVVDRTLPARVADQTELGQPRG